ncbi:hypothetical protein [Noviherbaspirillum aridicola]|uniref:Uncharacterized protein n=1 Tax=Noviherbaspirillum aridicola TaxID=2849687 RepID=A0ABQ4PZY8_9BURK|nr:hypothetical protein [Noviherbaspirillum aridicola]GIZ50383.1 hypothetical protein NCCP691_03970 [Noviherbaspirillum aridicola]
MAANTKNKYPADKTGTKYSEFRNTKRIAPGKVKAAAETKQSGGTTAQTGGKAAQPAQ